MSQASTTTKPLKNSAKRLRRNRSSGKPRKPPIYHVVLLNDNDHTYEYVIEMLKVIFGYQEHMGFKLAEEVDHSGRAIIYTGMLERAEFKRDQIHAFGTDERVATCRGSMSAILQAAA